MIFAWKPAWDLLWSIAYITILNYSFAWILRSIIRFFSKNKCNAEITYIRSFIPTYGILLLTSIFSDSNSILALIPYAFFLWYILAREQNYSKDIKRFLLFIALGSLAIVEIFNKSLEIYLFFFTTFLLLFTTLPAFISYLVLMFFDKKRVRFSIIVEDKIDHKITPDRNVSLLKMVSKLSVLKIRYGKFSKKHKWVAAIIGLVLLPILNDLLKSLIVTAFKTLFSLIKF